jgi:3-phenylpropionate/cinnamic acid dioxygenase small subunit
VSGFDLGTTSQTLDGIILEHEVSQFLFREASLLDERRFDEWLALLADDMRYTVPIRINAEPAAAGNGTRPGSDMCWFDEGKETLAQRVEQLAADSHWAEEPASRVCRIVSNVRVEATDPPEVRVRCSFVFYRNRVIEETDLLAGKRTDVLRRAGDSWLIAQRHVELDQSVLLAKNLTVFL